MSFVQQRERRANAGSRMRALLDKEVDMEELFELDESEDEAFSGVEEEQVDTVDSDFDMEESEGEAEQEQLAEEEEKRIRQAERQAKRPNRQQQQYLQKPTVSRGTATTPTTATRPGRTTRNLQQDKQQQQPTTDTSNRQSLRTKTILNRMHVEEQMRESESKRARIPKRIRPEIQRLTQEELLAEAAITEQENRASLEQWQQKEAERQAKSKIKVKHRIQGPFIRYHSFSDGATNERPQQRKLVMIMDDTDGKTTQVDITDPSVLDFHYRRDVEECDISAKTQITFFPGDPTDIPINATTNNNNDNDTTMGEADELDTNQRNNTLQHVKTEGLSDRELDRLDRIPPLASWADRSARPIRPLPCPITGKESRYREPMTQTPFSDATSYANIKNCLNHQYIWSPSLGIYVGNESDSKGAEGVPDGWEHMLRGKRPEEDDWMSPLPSWMESGSKESSQAQTQEQQNDTKPKRKKQRHRT